MYVQKYWCENVQNAAGYSLHYSTLALMFWQVEAEVRFRQPETVTHQDAPRPNHS